MSYRPWSPELIIYRDTEDKKVHLISLSENNLQWQLSIDSLPRALMCGGSHVLYNSFFLFIPLPIFPLFSLPPFSLSSSFPPPFFCLFTVPHSCPFSSSLSFSSSLLSFSSSVYVSTSSKIVELLICFFVLLVFTSWASFKNKCPQLSQNVSVECWVLRASFIRSC